MAISFDPEDAYHIKEWFIIQLLGEVISSPFLTEHGRGVKNIGIMTCAYVDCFAGISGDMMLGALVDLGMPVDLLTAELGKLALEDFRITTARKERMGIHGASVRVIVNEKKGVSRDYKSIRTIIRKSPLSDSVKELSLKIFGKLAGAEARIHKGHYVVSLVREFTENKLPNVKIIPSYYKLL